MKENLLRVIRLLEGKYFACDDRNQYKVGADLGIKINKGII